MSHPQGWSSSPASSGWPRGLVGKTSACRLVSGPEQPWERWWCDLLVSLGDPRMQDTWSSSLGDEELTTKGPAAPTRHTLLYPGSSLRSEAMSTTGSLSQKPRCSKMQPPGDGGREGGSWDGAGQGAAVSPRHKAPEGQWHRPPGGALREEVFLHQKKSRTKEGSWTSDSLEVQQLIQGGPMN